MCGLCGYTEIILLLIKIQVEKISLCDSHTQRNSYIFQRLLSSHTFFSNAFFQTLFFQMLLAYPIECGILLIDLRLSEYQV